MRYVSLQHSALTMNQQVIGGIRRMRSTPTYSRSLPCTSLPFVVGSAISLIAFSTLSHLVTHKSGLIS